MACSRFISSQFLHKNQNHLSYEQNQGKGKCLHKVKVKSSLGAGFLDVGEYTSFCLPEEVGENGLTRCCS